MNKYFIFFTNHDGQEELGGSHYDFERMCGVIETFLETNKERDFAFVSACQQGQDGQVEEVVRWKKGSLTPVFDQRA